MLAAAHACRDLMHAVMDFVALPRQLRRDVMAECRYHREHCPAMAGSAPGAKAPTPTSSNRMPHADLVRAVAEMPMVVSMKQVAEHVAQAIKQHCKAMSWCVLS